jgi:hypothetical protein
VGGFAQRESQKATVLSRFSTRHSNQSLSRGYLPQKTRERPVFLELGAMARWVMTGLLSKRLRRSFVTRVGVALPGHSNGVGEVDEIDVRCGRAFLW